MGSSSRPTKSTQSSTRDGSVTSAFDERRPPTPLGDRQLRGAVSTRPRSGTTGSWVDGDIRDANKRRPLRPQMTACSSGWITAGVACSSSVTRRVGRRSVWSNGMAITRSTRSPLSATWAIWTTSRSDVRTARGRGRGRAGLVPEGHQHRPRVPGAVLSPTAGLESRSPRVDGVCRRRTSDTGQRCVGVPEFRHAPSELVPRLPGRSSFSSRRHRDCKAARPKRGRRARRRCRRLRSTPSGPHVQLCSYEARRMRRKATSGAVSTTR